MSTPAGNDSRWLDKPDNVEKIFKALVAVCVALVVADLLYHRHASFDFEEMPGFYAFFGFVAYVGLVLTAKQLRRVLMRDEDYYGE